MSSHKQINVDSPRQGIMKSAKNISNVKNKNIKLDFIMSRKSISIDDVTNSLKGNQPMTLKDI